MKIKLLLIATFLLSLNLKSQRLSIEFDHQPFSMDYKKALKNDSSISNRFWQVGYPIKTIFNYDSTHKRALCTDTANYIGSHDTFSIIAEFIRRVDVASFEIEIQFDYKFDGDSGDYGMVEISTDRGKSWVNLILEDSTYSIKWKDGKPNLNGKLHIWQNFHADLSIWNLDWTKKKYPKILFGQDTILYRFTFIAGNTISNREGWIIDNLILNHGFSSIKDNPKNTGGFYFRPNPGMDLFSIENNNEHIATQVILYNSVGQIVLDINGENISEIDLGHLAPGIYTAQVLSGVQWYALRLVKE